jgi:hypothetical protein
MKKFFKKLSHILATLIGAILLSLFLFMSYCSYEVGYKPYRGKKFSKEAWQKADKIYKKSYGISGLCSMYNDIVTNHLKKGMKLKEVEDLLGDDGLKYYCVGNKKIKCLYYSLGLCYASAWTRAGGTLTICFNEKHEVVDFGKDTAMNKKYCSKGEIYCEGRPKCKCYVKDKLNGEECDFEVDKW